MKNIKLTLLILISLISLNTFAQQNPLWLRYPAISPNGQTILFNYKGDIYKVPATGGTAVPITISDSYEYSAVWSNDGNNIAFASDRYGNFDVFVMPATGGDEKRLTFHSTGEKPSSFTSDNKNIIFTCSSARFTHQRTISFWSNGRIVQCPRNRWQGFAIAHLTST